MDLTQHSLQKKGGVSYGTLTLVIIITLLLAFIVFKNLGSIGGWISGTVFQEASGFDIGQNVNLAGEIVQNGDYVSYTHTLTTPDHGVVGIKSRSLDLSQYTGIISIQGVVEKVQNSLYIIEVTAVSGSSAVVSGVVEATSLTPEGTYLPSAGIYLSSAFTSLYTLENNGADTLQFKRLSNGQVVKLSYFACKVSDPNKDCAQLVKNFSPSAEKTFTTFYADKFYKIESVNSWFMSNNNFYGYFIDDTAEQEVRDLANALIFVNASYVDDVLLSKITPLCTDSIVSIQKVTSHTLLKDINGLAVQLQGTTAEGTAQCKIVLDPSLAQGGQKLSFTPSTSVTPTPTSTPTPTPSQGSSASNLDFSVTQFPVSADKTMSYTSSRGHTIIFPSRNISFGAVSVDDDISIAGVHCSSQMNVVKFSDKALLTTTPMVKIFECTSKKAITLPSNAFLQTTLSDGRIFIIEIMNGAWKDFANKIVIALT